MPPTTLNLEALETSFDLVAPRGDDLVDRFYARLFATAPSFKPLFAGTDLQRQKAMLLATLVLLRKSLRNLDAIVPKLRDLGARHVAYGAEAAHYPVVGAVLIGAMAEIAGDAWEQRYADAWGEAFGVVAAVMLEGAAEAELPAYASSVQSLPATVRRRMTGSSHDPARCPVALDDLQLLTLRHVGFDGRARTGRLIVHRRHARDVVEVFRDLYEARFPIRRMELVDAYGDDDRSMAADNSSAYNCRTVAGQSSFSDHAYGAAIDLNPIENPYVTARGVLPPAGRPFVDVDRKPKAAAGPGVIVADDIVVRAFARIGWKWGGVWNEADYQHFPAP
jgi:hemoglobin-like flavoprotein